MSARRLIVVGGGPAGFFGAITCAEMARDTEVLLLEKSGNFLSKVRISGGGRCNVTHACFEPRELAKHYPRGEGALIAPFTRFQPRDTIKWFESRGVALKTEDDGRIFPVSDSSQSVIDCLLQAARTAGVEYKSNCGVSQVARRDGGGFKLELAGGKCVECEYLLLATGGGQSAARFASSLGHTITEPVPSLFTFEIETPWLRKLAGVSVKPVEVGVPGTKLCECGPILVTHWGLSGPVILRLSAWGARVLHGMQYRFPIAINWLPQFNPEQLRSELASLGKTYAARQVGNTPLAPLPGRLWEALLLAAGLDPAMRWSALSRAALHKLTEQLNCTVFRVSGKSLNKEEFVTCGGIRLSEVNFKTMESKLCPGLYFAGEILDIDGITGGFNFQAAWTTGWIAGRAIGGNDDIAFARQAEGS